MQKVIKRFHLFGYKFNWVVRHRWEEENLLTNYQAAKLRSNPSLGIWINKNRVVGKKNFNEPDKWKNNMVNSYMIGFDLVVAKTWINFSKGAMSLKVKN